MILAKVRGKNRQVSSLMICADVEKPGAQSVGQIALEGIPRQTVRLCSNAAGLEVL